LFWSAYCGKYQHENFQKIEENRYVSNYDIRVKELNIDQKTVLEHLYKAGYTKKLDVWILIRNLINRIFMRIAETKQN